MTMETCQYLFSGTLFFPLYNFTNATRAGRSCINLFILASLSILVLIFLSYIQNPSKKSLFRGNKPEASLRTEFKAVCLSIRPSSTHQSSLHLFSTWEEHDPSQVSSLMKHEKSPPQNFYWSRSEFHMGGRTETQTLTDEAEGILNVIYLTTECSTRTEHGECDSLGRTNMNPLRTRWVIELGTKTQTVGTHNGGEGRKSSAAETRTLAGRRKATREIRLDIRYDKTAEWQHSLDTPGRKDTAQVRKSKWKQSGKRERLREHTDVDR